jgi:hypothetical protein
MLTFLLHKFFGTRLVKAYYKVETLTFGTIFILEHGQCTPAANQYKCNPSQS